MKKLILALPLILAGCVSDPVDVSASYLEADLETYETLADPIGSLLDAERGRSMDARTINPWTEAPFTDADLDAFDLVMDSWKLRLEAVE